MKQLFSISKPENNSHLIWEHALKSVLGFAGTFAATFFGPMFLGSRSHRLNRSDEDSLSMKIITFFLENPEINLAICSLVVIIYNVIIFRKNSRIEHVNSISIDESTIEITTTNLRFKNEKTFLIPKSNCIIEFNEKEDEFGEKLRKLKFFDSESLIGYINPKNLFWSEKLPQIQHMINQLKNENIEFRKVDIRSKSKGFTR